VIACSVITVIGLYRDSPDPGCAASIGYLKISSLAVADDVPHLAAFRRRLIGLVQRPVHLPGDRVRPIAKVV
jgi:hypothetical protein